MASDAYWAKEASKALKGKTVEKVRYMTKSECDNMGWYNRPVVIQFTDGTLIFPSADDEGNDGGAMFGQDPKGKDITMPVLR
jgi:hypothetical protein